MVQAEGKVIMKTRPRSKPVQSAPAFLRLAIFLFLSPLCLADETSFARNNSWQETMLAYRDSISKLNDVAKEKAAHDAWEEMMAGFPIQSDWAIQDGGLDFPKWFATQNDTGTEINMISKAIAELGAEADTFRQELDKLVNAKIPPTDRRWLDLYARACEKRRAIRLRTLTQTAPKMVFVKHHIITPSFFAYTEGQSDAQGEKNFPTNSALCLLEMDGMYGAVRTLLEDKGGRIRDPSVSYDGKRVLFAWKKSSNMDDYHLYEMEMATGKIRQLTFGLGFADFEGTYLPNGNIIFSSTRCVQSVDCFWTEVSNLYTCDKDGRFMRRLGFDQVHTVFPTVMDDGRIVYTRWDYNDRGQIFPQPLFQMNWDGTGQTEYYGNNSWFPTTITHAREIPGTGKVVAILCGHHSPQTGKLAIIDPSKGRQENSGVQLIAPVRETPAERIDSYGQNGELFQYPYPLNETEFIVTYSPYGWNRPSRGKKTWNTDLGIYYMDIHGKRELLASDPLAPCTQPVPLMPRKAPSIRPSMVDHNKTTGTYYMKDIYTGPGLNGVKRGSIKKLRVVALDFRAAVIGANISSGPAGDAMASTPISIGNGSWDVKVVLGDARVYDDGSAFFIAPARTPLYFQAIDENGCAAQTMRSWSTLQPGENSSCIGCHESKNSAPVPEGKTIMAMKKGAQKLKPFYGPPRGFSFQKEIQPILDRKCVICHNNTAPDSAFSLASRENIDESAKRKWSDSYLALTNARQKDKAHHAGAYTGTTNIIVNWIGAQSVPEMIPPYFAGAATSKLLTMLRNGHKKVKLSAEEMEKLACWIDLYVPYCGDYTEANAWSEDESRKYNHFVEKRKSMEKTENENIQAMIKSGNK